MCETNTTSGQNVLAAPTVTLYMPAVEDTVGLIAWWQLTWKCVDWYLVEHGKIKFNVTNCNVFCFVTLLQSMASLLQLYIYIYI